MSDEKEKKNGKAASDTESGRDGEVSAQDENLSLFHGTFVNDDEDYEARFMKDAMQRAHDRELAALANLALIRNDRDERNMLLMTLEQEQAMSPREVNRRLNAAEAAPKPPEKKE